MSLSKTRREEKLQQVGVSKYIVRKIILYDVRKEKDKRNRKIVCGLTISATIACRIFHLRIVLMLVWIETCSHASGSKELFKQMHEVKSRTFIILKDHDKI